MRYSLLLVMAISLDVLGQPVPYRAPRAGGGSQVRSGVSVISPEVNRALTGGGYSRPTAWTMMTPITHSQPAGGSSTSGGGVARGESSGGVRPRSRVRPPTADDVRRNFELIDEQVPGVLDENDHSPGELHEMTNRLCSSPPVKPRLMSLAEPSSFTNMFQRECVSFDPFTGGLGSLHRFSGQFFSYSDAFDCSLEDNRELRGAEPIHDPSDRKFCGCVRSKTMTQIPRVPSPELKISALKGLLRSYLKDVLRPQIQLESEMRYARPPESSRCNLSSFVSRLGGLSESAQFTNNYCTSERCAEGESLLDQAIVELAGAGSSSPDQIMERFNQLQSKNIEPLINSNGQEKYSCLLNKRANSIAALLPTGTSGAGPSVELENKRANLQRYLSNLGDCTSETSIDHLLSTSVAEPQFQDLFMIVPNARAIFMNAGLEVTSQRAQCQRARRLVEKGISLVESQISSLSSGDIKSAYKRIDQIQNELVDLAREVPSPVLARLDADLAHRCESIQNNIQQISCASTGFIGGQVMATNVIQASNYQSICPGATSLTACRNTMVCSSYQEDKAGFLDQLESSDDGFEARQTDLGSDRSFVAIDSLCNGFENFIKAHSENPCRDLAGADYDQCYKETVGSDSETHKKLLAAFASDLLKSGKPEDRRRAEFFSEHTKIGISANDLELDEAMKINARLTASRLVASSTIRSVRSLLGPNATREQIMSAVKAEMSQTKEAVMSSMGFKSRDVQPVTTAKSSIPSQQTKTSFIAAPGPMTQTSTIVQAPTTVSTQLVETPVSSISGDGENQNSLTREITDLRRSFDEFRQSATASVTPEQKVSPRKRSSSQVVSEQPSSDEPELESAPAANSSGFVSGSRRRAPASTNTAQPQPQVQAQSFTPPAGAVVYNSVAEAVSSLEQARIQGGGQLKLRAAGSGVAGSTTRNGVPLDQILTVSVMDASNVEQVLEGIRAQFNSQILNENEVRFVEVRDGGKSTIYKVQKLNGELLIEEALSPEEVASGVLIESASRQPRVVRFTLSGLSSRLNEAIQRD